MCRDDHDLLLLIIHTQRAHGKVLHEILTVVGSNDDQVKSLTDELKQSHDALQEAIDSNQP